MYKLHVRVIEATDIPKMDTNVSDPYCIFQTSSQTQKTTVIQNTKNPRWNQEFHFNVAATQAGALDIKMVDKDIRNDDDMATLNILFTLIPIVQVIDQWYGMVPFKKAKKGGIIHLCHHL